MEKVGTFLKRHHDGKSPLLLGYSGGPDSKALLYALLKAGCETLQIAHVDHGWREESREEADALQKEALSLGVPFHSTRLSQREGGNKEAIARDARFSYFASLFEKIPFQALLLGHQADDLAETALKRLLEGAHLPFLGGMEPVSQRGAMTLWRPLLQTRKREILSFLEEKNLTPLFDPTNRDPIYLRSRLREETLPLLSRSFGKEIIENLLLLSERARELKGYLDRRVAAHPVHRGEWGAALDSRGLERIELRHLLQKIAGEEGAVLEPILDGAKLVLPRTVLEPILDWVEEGISYRKIYFRSKWLIARRGWVFILHSDSGKALPEKGMIRKLIISFTATAYKPNG